MTDDEVTHAMYRRWVRQLGETAAEVIQAEVPREEHAATAQALIDALRAKLLGFQSHEDSPTVVMHMNDLGVPCPECDR